MLWVVAISAHSPFAFASPRNRSDSGLWLFMIWIKTGSTKSCAGLKHRLACFGPELAVHPAPSIEISGDSTPRRSGPLAMLLAVGGDVGIQTPLLKVPRLAVLQQPASAAKTSGSWSVLTWIRSSMDSR